MDQTVVNTVNNLYYSFSLYMPRMEVESVCLVQQTKMYIDLDYSAQRINTPVNTSVNGVGD